jgi:hypothetical protein
MKANGRASESTVAEPGDSRAEVNVRHSPDAVQAGSLCGGVSSRELIARQRALLQDIREVIALTRKIIGSTREQLDRFNSLGVNLRTVGAPERASPLESDPEAWGA